MCCVLPACASSLVSLRRRISIAFVLVCCCFFAFWSFFLGCSYLFFLEIYYILLIISTYSCTWYPKIKAFSLDDPCHSIKIRATLSQGVVYTCQCGYGESYHFLHICSIKRSHTLTTNKFENVHEKKTYFVLLEQ